MNVLHIESSPRGEQSDSRHIAEELVEALRSEKSATVVFRDLNHPVIPHVSQDWVNASLYNRFTGAPMTDAETEALRFSRELIAEVKAADVVVLGVPMYNYGIPSVAKAWCDNIAMMGETFVYTDKGVKGLLENKTVIAVSARGGGGYDKGEPRAEVNYVDDYVHAFFGFLGIETVRVITLHNTAQGGDALEASKQKARTAIRAVIAEL